MLCYEWAKIVRYIQQYSTLYLIVGIFMWFFTHESGVHATIAGVLLAITIPHKQDSSHHGKSMLKHVEHTLAPYVSFIIMPIFAFANAGVNFDGMSFAQFLEPVPIGICLGLFIGKQVGVFIFSVGAIKFGLAEKPNDASWGSFYGVGILTGIGFTMSLFVGNLAFVENSNYLGGVKIGVLVGSLLSTLLGYFILLIFAEKILSKTSIEVFFPSKFNLSIFIIFSFYQVFFLLLQQL